MLIETNDVVNAKEAARICEMTVRNFLNRKGDLRAVDVCGNLVYFRQEVIDWNQRRITGLKRQSKKHAAWQESCLHESPPCG